MKRFLNSLLAKTEKNGQQNVSRCSGQETLGPIARMAPGFYVLSLSHSYVDYVLGKGVLSFESYPRTLRIARSAKNFFVRELRNFVRG